MGDPIVMQLVSRVLDSGCSPEEACQDSPELLAEVRENLRRIRSVDAELEGLFPETPSALLHEGEPSDSVEELPHVPGHQVLSLLGHGGMGVVYKARHLRLNRTVAVKMLLGGAHTDRVGLKRLLREAEAVAALHHPNIVQVHEVGDHDGLPYFTMELVEGGSLRERLGEKPLGVREAATLVATLADAMEVAHASGIVHRDLKPANVLLTPDGVPKIADFGLARRIEEESSLTLSDARLGTPSYMAPEQARGESRAIGPAADVYALGAILYATLTGRPPFRSDSHAVTLRQVIEDEPVRPSRPNPLVPRDLETICLKCLSKDPTRRYSTAAALAADLRRFLRGEPILARPVGFLERTAKWVRRRPAHATIAAGSVLAVLSLVGFGLWLSIERNAIVQAAEQDLVEVDRAAATSSWTAARTALEKARARLMDGGSADLRAKVELRELELAVARRLEIIWLDRRPVAFGKRDRANNSKSDAEYEQAFLDLGIADVPRDPPETAARVSSSRIRAVLVSALDTWATCVADDDARRNGLLEAVRLADPDPTGWRDRVRDAANWTDRQALDELARTAQVSKGSIMLLLALAEHVVVAGGDAVPFLERIQREYPGDFWADYTLGLRLAESSQSEAAIRYFQAAIAVRPDCAFARSNLGRALGETGQIEDAMVHLRKAVLIAPTLGIPHVSLSTCLEDKGQYAEAIEELRTAMRLDPGLAEPSRQCRLSWMMLQLGKLDESIAAYREILRLDPRSPDAHYGLGYALHASGLLEEAGAEFRGAIAIESRSEAHESLGLVLEDLGRTDDAIASLREAVRLDPRRASSRRELVAALIARGHFEEARTEARLLLESPPAGDPSRPSAQDLLDHCQLLSELEADLPAILEGTRVPRGVAECLAFADLFRARQDHAAAARYFADAFESGDETSALGDRERFDAERCAALAATSGDKGADVVGDEERTSWRALALGLLREDLGALDAMLRTDAPGSRLTVLLGLMERSTAPALAGLRDAALLERLPGDERALWRALWSDADALSERARSSP